jgi:membrane fusion protein, multidrug efflux system
MVLIPTALTRFSPSVLALSLVLGLSGCDSKEAAAPAGSAPAAGARPAGGGGKRGGAGIPPVLVGKVQRKVVPLTLEAIGAVEPIRTAALRSQVTGNLLKLHFQEGQDVKEGDLLFEIDARPFLNAVHSTEADLEKLRVQLGTAQAQVVRYRSLTEQSMVSKEQFQTIQDTERALQAQILSSEAAAANAKLQLEFCSIRAPLSGRTGNVGAHEGDLVRASDTAVTLVTIHQLSPIYVTFSRAQQDLGLITRYRAAGEIEVACAPAGSEEATEKGELSFIDNAVDSTTGTIKLKASFPNEAHRLWPGLFASVRITLASPEVLTVPTPAVQNDQRGQHVFVVTADQTAELRDVVIERSFEGDSVVTKGLQEGETVIVDGQLRVLPGKPVEVKSPPGSTTPGEAPRGKGKGKGKPKTSDSEPTAGTVAPGPASPSP